MPKLPLEAEKRSLLLSTRAEQTTNTAKDTTKGYNNSRRENTPRKEKFLGADPDLRGYVFEAKRNQSEQVVNFTTVKDIIKAQVGTECDPFVLKSLEKKIKSLPEKHP